MKPGAAHDTVDHPSHYTSHPSGVECITVVEVMRPDDGIELRVRAGAYPWVALGMLEWAKKVIESLPIGEEEE